MKDANSGPLYLLLHPFCPSALNTYFISYHTMLPKDNGIACNIGAKYNTWTRVWMYQWNLITGQACSTLLRKITMLWHSF